MRFAFIPFEVQFDLYEGVGRIDIGHISFGDIHDDYGFSVFYFERILVIDHNTEQVFAAHCIDILGLGRLWSRWQRYKGKNDDNNNDSTN